jgi:hypothetical protein
MTSQFFPPLPEADIDLDQIKQWIQRNVDTFYRAVVFTGDVTLQGFLRTAGTGARIEIRPDGANNVPSIAWFDPDGQSAFAEIEDQGSGVYALKIAGPNAGGGAPIAKFREDGILVLDSDNSSGFIELFKYLKMNSPIRASDGTVGAPSITFAATDQQDVGFYRADTDEIGVAAGGAEIARFSADAGHNLQGLAWQAFTPVLVSLTGTQPVLGTGGTIQNGRWVRIGDKVIVQGQIRYGTTGVTIGTGNFGVKFGDGLTNGPPDASTALGTGAVALPIGIGRLTDNNTGNVYFLDIDLFSTNRVAFWNRASPATATTQIAPITLAVSDYFGFSFVYEAA